MVKKPVQKPDAPAAPRPARTSMGTPGKATPSPRAKASVSTKKLSATAKPERYALVVGVSNYPAPISKLPAVAADVREVAKVLASRNGTFPSAGVTVLTEKLAMREQVRAAIKEVLTKATEDDTVFVYLAGHGSVEGGKYYYIPYDAKVGTLAQTGVPLAEIKRLFNRTASRRVFLWLDFCHSGGITERGTAGDDIAAIKREIGVLSGHGKVIVAACTPEQSAYESPSVGHGLFTHALLRGLKGEAKSAAGEVTALSLYDFIDREVKHPNQQPTLFGQMAGRIVLMHYPAAGSPKKAASTAAAQPVKQTPTVKSANATTARRVSSSGILILLDGRVYITQSVDEASGGEFSIRIASPSSEEEIALRSLKGDRFSSKEISVAFSNQAFKGRVEDVTFQTTGTKTLCTVTVKAGKRETSYMSGVSYNGVSAEQQAEMRARTLLLDEKPSVREAAWDQSLRSFVLSPLEEAGVQGGIFPSIRQAWKGTPANLLRAARLWAVHYLKSADICDEVLELTLGPAKDGKLPVKFRGTRKSQYSNHPPHEIVVEGVSPF